MADNVFEIVFTSFFIFLAVFKFILFFIRICFFYKELLGK